MSSSKSLNSSKAPPAESVEDLSSGTESDDSDVVMDFARPGGGAGDDDSGESDSSDDDGMITVEFVFVDPSPIDYKSVRRLLESYLPNVKTFNASAMSEVVIAQVQLGTMVKVKDDLDCYAIATIINLGLHKVRVGSRLRPGMFPLRLSTRCMRIGGGLG